MSETVTRGLSGAVYVAVFVTAILSGYELAGTLLMIFMLFSLWEFYKIQITGDMFSKTLHIAMAGVIFAISLMATDTDYLLPPLAWLVIPISLICYVIGQEKDIRQWAILIGGVCYITVPFMLFYQSAWLADDYDAWSLLTVLILIWSSDTFAYLVGKKWGKHKLAPDISPAKSWEGWFGGLAGTLLVAFIIFHFKGSESLGYYMAVSVLVCVFGVIGDLFESKMKRNLGIKDSGKMMPGHGGFLDRFDSLLMVAPVYYIFRWLWLLI
jgi:phosphatidate cytidylyltransferase